MFISDVFLLDKLLPKLNLDYVYSTTNYTEQISVADHEYIKHIGNWVD